MSFSVMTKEYAKARIPELEKLCKYRPTSTMLADLAGCYFTCDQPERALPLSEMAWEKNKHPTIGMNLALIYKDLGRHDDAFRTVETAYWLNPDDEYIKLGYGEALLKAGFWKEAWTIYDNTRPTQQGAMYDLRLPKTVYEWQGEDLKEGHLLLVINEGGTGDRLSYARWLPELTKRGINWKFYPYDELFDIFARVIPRERLIKDGEDIIGTHWVTTFALPAKLRVGPNEVPPPIKLVATPESIEKYKMEHPDNFPIVGICYGAAERFQGDRKVRSISEAQAQRLICMTGDKVHWVSLQHGITMPYPVSNIPFLTWEDTLGLMHNLDAVVTVDTSVWHAAGGMGKPMSVLLTSNACWKLLKKPFKVPDWYPTAKYYRNEGHGPGIEHAITELIADIRNGTAWPSTAR